MIGIKDVAKRAGVSISTVSHVLNHTKYVSPEYCERVEQAVQELHYEVNPIARSMKSNKTGTIGVITEDMCGMFYPYVVRGINSIVMEKGYQMVICDAQSTYGDKAAVEREENLFRRLIGSRVDGIIFASTVQKEESGRYFDKIRKLTNSTKKVIPLVSLERDFTSVGIDSVYFDGIENSAKAIRHLIDCGCKKICHISGPREMEIAQERIRGYESYMRFLGTEYEKNMLVVNGDYSHQSGYTCMKKILDKIPDVDGVFVGNDQMAVGAIKCLQEQKKRIPEDVKIIGYDDVFLASVMEPSLSTIHIRKRHAGIEAAKILFQRIENQETNYEPKKIRMEGKLVIRKSTRPDSPEDWNLVDW